MIQSSFTVKALSDDTIFACDCSRLHQPRFESCRVRGTIVSCETAFNRKTTQHILKIVIKQLWQIYYTCNIVYIQKTNRNKNNNN